MKFKCAQSVLIILSLVFQLSCSSKKESAKEYETRNYKAVVTDSLVFDWLPEVKLLDYNEETEELLLESQREIIVIDKEGNIVSQFNPHIEGPNYVGDFDFGWIFYGKDQLMCYAQYYFHLVEKSGERIKRFPYPVDVSSIWMLDHDPQLSFNYQVGDQERFVAMITGPEGPNYRTQAFQDSVHMVYRINVENETGEAIIQKPEVSVYRTLGQYVDRGWPYMRNFRDSKFALIYAVDNFIYFYDAETNEHYRTIEIPDEYKPKFQAVDFESTDKVDRLKINTNLYSTRDYIAIQTIDRIPLAVEETYNSQPRYRESDAYKAAVAKYLKSAFILFDEERFLGPLTFDIGKYEYFKLSTQSDFMWFQRRYDDERDYRTFLKVKIVPVEE